MSEVNSHRANAESTVRSTYSGETRTALILYGSETGNAQDVAEEICRLTSRLHFHSVVIDLDSIQLRDLLRYTIVVFVVSTTGQGEFPQNARAFWKTLLSGALKAKVLRKLVFASFGLGDSSYPRYNVAHRMLHARLLQLGAKAVCDRGEGNEQHPEGHAAGLRLWLDICAKSILSSFPLPRGQTTLSEDALIAPPWKLNFARPSKQPGNHRDTVSNNNGSSNQDASVTEAAAPSPVTLPLRQGYVAHITANQKLTPDTHFQDVRLLDLVLQAEYDYGPGAVAVVHPKNFPEDVASFIQLMHWEEIAETPLTLITTQDPTDARGISAPSPLRHFDLSGVQLTLRWLLENVLDIMSIPRRSFFAQLAQFATEDDEDQAYQKERLLELANPSLIDELWDYTTRPKRTILEVMMDFTLVKLPWQYALTLLPIMRGRQFSIASGGMLKHAEDGGTKIQLLVAIVDPPSPIIKWRRRYGVCTRYIASLQAGQDLAIGLHPGYLNASRAELESPVIMVGPGTGVAPMRAMLYQRLAWNKQKALPLEKPLVNDVLFFGCRTAIDDYFFSQEWEALAQSNGLHVLAAFSRDPGQPKEYVQDKIRLHADLVSTALIEKGAKVYVCGSSGNMPKGVREALLDVIATHDSIQSRATAERYLDDLETDGRYKQETW